MIRVTVEVVPHGDEEKVEKIGEMIIGLQRVDVGMGDYRVWLKSKSRAGRWSTRARDLFEWPRIKMNAMDLVCACFEATRGRRARDLLSRRRKDER